MLVGGVEFIQEKQYVLFFICSGMLLVVNLYNLNLNDFKIYMMMVIGYNDGKIDIVLVYLFDIVKFNDQWLINVGICEDYYCIMYYFNVVGIIINFLILGNLFNWKLVVIYKLIDYSSIYVLYVIFQQLLGGSNFVLLVLVNSVVNSNYVL